jgi:hypothetical protein
VHKQDKQRLAEVRVQLGCVSKNERSNSKIIHGRHRLKGADRDVEVEADEGVGRPADTVEETHQRQREGHVLNTLGLDNVPLHKKTVVSSEFER